jgi:hypothetical protein
MGGPSGAVAVREALTEGQLAQLDAWLCTLDPARTRQVTSYPGLPSRVEWRVVISDAAAIGMPPVSIAHPLPVSIALSWVKPPQDFASDASVADPRADAEQWLTQVGWYPQQVFNLSTVSKQEICHRILGYVALRLAERYDSVLDVLGRWYPLRDPDVVLDEAVQEVFPLWLLDVPRTFLYGGPGHVYEIRDGMSGSEPSWYNLADIEAFRAHLLRPDFCLIW